METNQKSPEKASPSPIPKVSASKYRGLGDVVHAVASPIAALSDKVLKTDLKHCSGCQKRREWLNEKVHFCD